MALPAEECIRLFPLHIVPSASSAVGTSASSPIAPAPLLRLTGIDIERCQVCGQGRLASVEMPRPTRPIPVRAPDTS